MMIEILAIALFCWIFIGAVRLTFKVTWGLAKIVAMILFALALPTLVSCLLIASGIVLLIPIVLVAVAWGVLKACV